MAAIALIMPRCGEDGVIIATRSDGVRVEFRGRPYSRWEIGEDTPMYHLHSCLQRVNISDLHCGLEQVVTSWHPEWLTVMRMFNEALETVV